MLRHLVSSVLGLAAVRVRPGSRAAESCSTGVSIGQPLGVLFVIR